MNFDDKRTLLHWLFDGKDKEGTPYGIYISKTGERKEQKIDYFIYGRITGLRTLKGDDPNHDDNNNFNTNKDGLQPLQPSDITNPVFLPAPLATIHISSLLHTTLQH